MSVTRPALRYHGGKWTLAPWIISHFPQHDIYVEPFGGGASVLLRKERVYAEIYNDRWDTVVNVFRCLRDAKKAEELRELLRLTPFARSEFDLASSARRRPRKEGDVEAARMMLLRSYAAYGSASINGDKATGFRTYSKKNRRAIPAHDWASWPDAITGFTERLRGVIIENRDAEDVIAQHDTPTTLFYLDPPYPHSTRNMRRGNAEYAFEMSDADHRQLAEVVRGIKGMAVISGYDCELYRELYGDWKKVERDCFADGARKRTEVLWMSPATLRSHTQQPLLSMNSHAEVPA